MISRRSFLTGISAAALATTVLKDPTPDDGVALMSMAHPMPDDPPQGLRWMTRQQYEDTAYIGPHTVIDHLPSNQAGPDVWTHDYLLIRYDLTTMSNPSPTITPSPHG
jgi:hypothetical protein